MGSVGVEFYCNRCWFPRPFDGYHLDGASMLVCSPCLRSLVELNGRCRALHDFTLLELPTAASEIEAIGEMVKTSEKRLAFLHGSDEGMEHWRPYVQAVHDARQWDEPLPQPSIKAAMHARIHATADVCEKVPIPSWILRQWREETRPIPDDAVNRMQIEGVLHRLREWFLSTAPVSKLEQVAKEIIAERPLQVQLQELDVKKVEDAFSRVCPATLLTEPEANLDGMIPTMLDYANTLSRILRADVSTPQWVADRLKAQLDKRREEQGRERQ